MANKSNQAYKIAMVGLLAALSYVVFTYGQVKITLPGGDATSIHLGNAVCVIGALLVGGFYGGLVSIDQRKILFHRHGKWMVHSYVAILFL